MLVYGDRHERADPRQWAAGINGRLDVIDQAPAGLERHALLASVLVDGGRLLQGIADAEFDRHRCDRRTRAADSLGMFLLQVGRAVCRSWDSGFAETAPLPRLWRDGDWPGEVQLKLPEGFAFYGVYPEAYAEAARRLRLVGWPRVIGIRSIGTSLGAVAAAALEAPPPVTVRPFGDPFARQIAVDPALERELLHGEPHYVIVDEGPGQSGSSFAAVAGWLLERGVPLERVALLPSHAGEPGPGATAQRRRWWRTVQRQPADFGAEWPRVIARWCEAAVGPLDKSPVDLSGGEWRRLRYARDEDGKGWPAVLPGWERRKFLVSAGGERLLVKFAGLGRIGEEKIAIARALHGEKLVPEPIALAHGFMLERWCGDAQPLAQSEKPVREIGRYIGTRARLLPAASGSGASVDELLDMLRRNLSLEFGKDVAVERWERRAGELQRRIVRVRTDNKLDRHEWLRTASGGLLKTDALDHHQAHDLIGCQDSAWDVAGAILEFDLHQSEADALVAAVEHDSGSAVDRELLGFYRLAHAAFRLGQARLGASMVCDAAERQRIDRLGDLYAAELQHLLESGRAPTRPESLVG
jgi:hypothetical protein